MRSKIPLYTGVAVLLFTLAGSLMAEESGEDSVLSKEQTINKNKEDEVVSHLLLYKVERLSEFVTIKVDSGVTEEELLRVLVAIEKLDSEWGEVHREYLKKIKAAGYYLRVVKTAGRILRVVNVIDNYDDLFAARRYEVLVPVSVDASASVLYALMDLKAAYAVKAMKKISGNEREVNLQRLRTSWLNLASYYGDSQSYYTDMSEKHLDVFFRLVLVMFQLVELEEFRGDKSHDTPERDKGEIFHKMSAALAAAKKVEGRGDVDRNDAFENFSILYRYSPCSLQGLYSLRSDNTDLPRFGALLEDWCDSVVNLKQVQK